MTETFCIKCGSKLDKETGLCPRCDADKISQQYVEKIVKPAQDAQKIAETVNKEDEKKKARNMISKHKTGWEIKRFIVVMLCLVLVAGIALCVLTYFNILDVPAISTIMENVGINEILKNGKSDSSNISIKINDTIKATSYGNDLEWYEAYRQVLNNADLYKPDSSNCVAFRDMDQDGVPELFINVCASNAMEYNLQVWTYKEGKASLAGNMQVGITTAGWNTYIFGMDDGNICRKTVEGNDYIEQVSYEYYKLNGVSLMKTKTDEIICDNVQRNTDGYESDVYLNGAYICTTNNDGNELWDKIAEFADHVQTLMASIYTDKSCDQYTRVDMSESDATAYLDSQSKKIARSEIYENLNTTSIGDIVTFGSYEQDNNTSNGKEAIEWIVIDKNGTGALLLSKYALDCRKYNSETTDVTWGTCTLRNWLNEAFFDNAFNEMEKSKIKTTVVMADKNPDYDTNAGADTADKVFLLSIKEIEKYFNTDEERMCAPTEYAIANGAFITDLYSVDGKVTCGWWLRSPGDVSDSAAGIDCDGWIGISGIDVSNDMGCVRPALWVELENEVEIAASEDYLEKTTENEVSEENLLTRVTVSGNVTNAIFKEYSYEDIIKHWAIWDDSIWGIHSELDLFDNCEWILEYDDTGNLISETWNDNYNNTGVMNYTYDDNGNLLTETAIRNGIITHRLTIERDSSGKKISQITETSPESDVGYSIKLQYDEYENVVRSENGQSGVLWTYDRTYDDNGNPLSVMWRQFMPVDDVEPNAMSTTIYEYDSNGKLLKEVVQNDYLQVSETTYTRTEDGKPLTRDYQDNYRGNNTYTEWEYDDAGNLISITQNDDYNGTSVESYDGDGNLLRYTDEDKTTEYSYDEKGNQTEVICTYKEESNKNYTIWREFYEDGTKKTEHLTGATSNGIYYQRQCEWNQKGCLLEVCITSPYVSEQLDIVFEYGSQNTSNSYTYAAEGITWNFDESSDTLTISGNGAIVDYSDRKIQPWKNYKSNIKHIVVEDGVTSIGDGAFEEYTSLESVSISGDVSTIGKRAFWNCTNLAYLYLGEGIIEIHDQAFGNCDKLISLVIPNSVTFLGYAAFQSCDQLENITFGSGLTCIGISAFSEEPCLESITVPENVVTIDDGAFCNCENLSNVTLCEGIESIGEVAFAGTNINTLTIPGTVVSIG